MAGRTHLSPHLSNTELSKRARCAPNLVEARRWQLLALIADGSPDPAEQRQQANPLLIGGPAFDLRLRMHCPDLGYLVGELC